MVILTMFQQDVQRRMHREVVRYHEGVCPRLRRLPHFQKIARQKRRIAILKGTEGILLEYAV